jgi:hypothetical protein
VGGWVTGLAEQGRPTTPRRLVEFIKLPTSIQLECSRYLYTLGSFLLADNTSPKRSFT